LTNLFNQISHYSGIFPKRELEHIINNKEEYIPDLLEVVKQTRDNPIKVINNPTYMMHYYAMFLLTQFKVKEFLPIFTDILKLPVNIVDDLLGSFITEDVYRIITTFFMLDKDLNKIIKLIKAMK